MRREAEMRYASFCALWLVLATSTVTQAGGSNYGVAPGARPALDGKISEWPVPTPKFARDPAPGPDGNIYVAVMFGNRIARFDPRAKTFDTRTGAFTEYKTRGRPYGIAL